MTAGPRYDIFFSTQQADGGLWLVSPSQTSCRGMTSFQSVKQTCDHGQMPDGWKKCWSSPHDECLALAASITYHMYQLPDRKVWLQVGSVTQGNYIVQFLVMPPYSGAERKMFFLSLASFTVQRDLLQRPFYWWYRWKKLFQRQDTWLCAGLLMSRKYNFFLQKTQFLCNSCKRLPQGKKKHWGVCGFCSLCYLTVG